MGSASLVTDSQANELIELQRAILARLEELVRLRPRVNQDVRAFSKRQAERLLGIHRETLAAHLRAGTIKTVPWGKLARIPKDEIDRLLRDGLPQLPGAEPRALPPRARRSNGRPAGRAALAAKEGSPGDRIRALEV
jgi:excisionase family DNA binding protein